MFDVYLHIYINFDSNLNFLFPVSNQQLSSFSTHAASFSFPKTMHNTFSNVYLFESINLMRIGINNFHFESTNVFNFPFLQFQQPSFNCNNNARHILRHLSSHFNQFDLKKILHFLFQINKISYILLHGLPRSLCFARTNAQRMQILMSSLFSQCLAFAQHFFPASQFGL